MFSRLLHDTAATAILLLGMFALNACSPIDDARNDTQPVGSDGWLTGDAHQKFDTLANQLGGFDQTMIQIGYRYTELYWAGQDENWAYAQYQIEEMRGEMESGFERRPEREASAQPFMNHVLPQLEEAAVEGDRAMFEQRFAEMTNNCNACHTMEQVPFIVVREPTKRVNPWGGPNYVEPE